jgi:2,3-bisphosphoglycerate-dependent phosphoglycerate mutase
MRLCLVRHGETLWNAEQRIQGFADIPLNATGHAQAKALAQKLASVGFDAIVSSPLQRALVTAQTVAAGRPVCCDARLRERYFGSLQGLTRQEIAVRYPTIHACLAAREPCFDPPGGESVQTFAERVQSALSDLSQKGDCVLAVAHGGVLDIAYRLATGQDLASPRQRPLPNAAINWLHHDAHGWRIESFGLDDHLTQAKDDLG